MSANKKVEDNVLDAQGFAKAYQELCEKFGFRVVVTPVWLARDDGTFSMQLQYSVGKLPQVNKN
jgi:hypothetical protein